VVDTGTAAAAGFLGMCMSLRRALGCLAALFVAAPLAWADANHYVNVLVGERAAGMAGAYVAVSDDASGMFYNPAGISFARETSLSASMNAYRLVRDEYDGRVLGGQGWERTSSSLLPNYFGLTHPLGAGVLGFSYAVPDSVSTDQDQVFESLPASIPGVKVDRHRINFNEQDTLYLFGPSYGVELGPRLSVGLTLYAQRRTTEFILSQLVELSDGRFQLSSRYLDVDEWGIRPMVGFMVAPTDRIALGVSVAHAWVLHSDARSQVTLKPHDTNDVFEEVLDADDRRRYPYEVRFGVAVFPSQNWLISADAMYDSATRDPAFGDRRVTWNGAIGLEYYWSPSWAVRAGMFSDRANTPEVRNGGTDQMEHVDRYGASLSLTRFRRGASLTFGVIYARGKGEAQLVGGATDIQDVTETSITAFLAASYRN